MFDRKAYMKEYNKQYRENNKEKVLELCRKWREDNCNYIKKYNKKYQEDNREKILEQRKQWRMDNPNDGKQYYKINRIKINIRQKEYSKHKRETDLRFNLSCKMKVVIRYILKGNKAGKHWEDLVGYKLKDLIKHLKQTMPEGHSWEDFLNGDLHIDHIIPMSAYNFTKPEHIDFKRCWALSNLQLLPARENIIKSNKLTKPFQPALSLILKKYL